MEIHEHIRFAGTKIATKTINVTLEFQVNDGYYDCNICYNGIAVAYFDTSTGGIQALPLEIHKKNKANKDIWKTLKENDKGVLKEIKELQANGVEFDIKDDKEYVTQYCIKLEQGFY